MEQFLEISERGTALWLTQKQYIARQIFFEGIEGDTLGVCRKAARLKWKEEIQNKKTRTRNGELELACDTAPEVMATRGIQTPAHITGTRGLHAMSELDKELGKVANHGVRNTDFMNPAMGGVGELFRAGALASTNSAGNAPLPSTALLSWTHGDIGGSEISQAPPAWNGARRWSLGRCLRLGLGETEGS